MTFSHASPWLNIAASSHSAWNTCSLGHRVAPAFGASFRLWFAGYDSIMPGAQRNGTQRWPCCWTLL